MANVGGFFVRIKTNIWNANLWRIIIEKVRSRNAKGIKKIAGFLLQKAGFSYPIIWKPDANQQ